MGSSSRQSPRILKIHPIGNLTAEQGFILSRITEGMSMHELKSILPWGDEEAEAHLRDLIQKGALTIEAPSSKKGTDLDLDFCQALEEKWAQIESKNPYELLELPRNATTQDVRQQYLVLSRRFHPDRFFNRQLGSYRQQINEVFSEITKAYQKLKDPHERKAVDVRLKDKLGPAQSLSKEEMLSRLKVDPQMEKWVRAEEAYQEGLKQEKARHYIKALNCFSLSHQLNPKRAEYKRAHEALLPLATRQRAEERASESASLFKGQLYSEAFDASSEALRMDPQIPEAQMVWAKCIVELNKTEFFRDARERLLRAKASMPKSAEPSYFLARLHLIAGDTKSAKQELVEALKRESKHTAAQKLLEQI
jgi:curved DNA-binding protein CbpA